MSKFHVSIRLDWDVETTINQFVLRERIDEIVENLQTDGFFSKAKRQVLVTGTKSEAA
jgi:hypothetical protein